MLHLELELAGVEGSSIDSYKVPFSIAERIVDEKLGRSLQSSTAERFSKSCGKVFKQQKIRMENLQLPQNASKACVLGYC